MKKGLNFVVWYTGYLIFLIMYSERQGFPYGWFITEVKREIHIRCISEYTQLRYDCISYAGTCLIRYEVYSYCEKMDQKFDGYENEVERKRNFIQTLTNCRERSTRCVANIESFDRFFPELSTGFGSSSLIIWDTSTIVERLQRKKIRRPRREYHIYRTLFSLYCVVKFTEKLGSLLGRLRVRRLSF